MTDQDLNGEWARSQIEAWVDGSLTDANRERMRAALQRDPQLRAAAARAAAVQRALRGVAPAPLPRGLRRRLLAIPARPGRVWPRFALPVAAGVAALAVAVWWQRPVVPPPDERVAAIADFELAMQYLHESARFTQSEVTGAVGSGLHGAWAQSRESLERSTKENGG